jgi:hypothetical protein
MIITNIDEVQVGDVIEKNGEMMGRVSRVEGGLVFIEDREVKFLGRLGYDVFRAVRAPDYQDFKEREAGIVV